MDVSGSLSASRGAIPKLRKESEINYEENFGIENVRNERKRIATTNSLVSGALSGVISSILLQPLDVVKTRLQEFGSVERRAHNIALGIVRIDGITGLWRGWIPALIRVAPGASIYFCSLNSILNYYPVFSQITSYNAHSTYVPTWYNMGAAAFAKCVAITVVSPFTVIKCRMESTWADRPYANVSTRQIASLMAKNEGILSFYKGLIPTMIRDIPYSAIYFGLYEKLKEFSNSHQLVTNNTLLAFSLSIISGVVSSFLTHPADVLRTRMQLHGTSKQNHVNRNGAVTLTEDMVYNEGWCTLMKGLGPRVLKRSLMSALTWISYDEINRRVTKL